MERIGLLVVAELNSEIIVKEGWFVVGCRPCAVTHSLLEGRDPHFYIGF